MTADFLHDGGISEAGPGGGDSPGEPKISSCGKKPLILANGDGRIYGMFGLCRHENNPREGATMWDELIDIPSRTM
jgi:hypothetical protein